MPSTPCFVIWPTVEKYEKKSSSHPKPHPRYPLWVSFLKRYLSNFSQKIPSDTNFHVKSELHANIWSLNKQARGVNDSFWTLSRNKYEKRGATLEIGIMLYADQPRVSHLNFILPPNYSGLINDVSEELCKDDIIGALFNTETTLERKDRHSSCTIKTNDRNRQRSKTDTFTLLRFEEEDISLTRNGIYTHAKIKIPPYNTSQAAYIRCRFDPTALSGWVLTGEVPGSLFQGLFTRVEIVDFRVNEARLISDRIHHYIKSEGRFAFCLAHVYYVCASNETVDTSDNKYRGCRYLENGIWNDYINYHNRNSPHLLAHHWKFDVRDNIDNQELHSVTTFIRNTHSTKYDAILLSIAGIIFLSIIANLLTPQYQTYEILEKWLTPIKTASSLDTLTSTPPSDPSIHNFVERND